MSDQQQRNAVDSVAAVVRELNVVGLPTVLWTIIFCTALLKSDRETMSWMFSYLIRTWFALLFFWAASTAAAAYWRSRDKKPLVPVAVSDSGEGIEQKPAA